MDLLHWRRLWELHFPEFWHERGLFPSFQAPPSTVSLGTRASKHPIEQPPQPLDRSSLDLQNPERSSSLEAPRALTRHWSSRLSCPRATTHRCHIRTSEHGLLGSETTKRHHHWSPLQPIYHLEVDKSPSKRPRAYTRRSHLRNPWPTRQSLSQLWKLKSGLSELRFKKPAPLLDSSEDDLLFAVGIALIGLATHLHAPMTLRPFSPRAPIRPARVHACLAHACTRPTHVSSRCRSTGSPGQP